MTARKAVLLTSLLWLTVLASCASTKITTWLITDKGDLMHKTGSAEQHKTVAEAVKYRCYSEIDDTAWRKLLADYQACCSEK